MKSYCTKLSKGHCFFIMLSVVGILFILWIRSKKHTFAKITEFEIIGGTPYLVCEGLLYRYEEDNWQQAEHTGEIKQLVSAEYLCGLDADGKVFYEGNLENDGIEPLTSAYYISQAQELLKINETKPFTYISGDITGECMALLEDGKVLYSFQGEYYPIQLEEKPISLSGSYILTEQGNVYYIDKNVESVENVKLKSIYSEGNIIAIDASSNAEEGLGITKEGNVVSWGGSQNWTGLKVDDWKDVVIVEQDFHAAVGLTKQGKVLYKGASQAKTEAGMTEIQSWRNVMAVNIVVDIFGTTIYGVKADGSLLIKKLD